MVSESPIHIAAALISRADGRTLLVRKRGADAFMQPGGKIEVGETPPTALIRELHEELGLIVDERRLAPLGRFRAPAANEPARMVEADLFGLVIAEDVSPGAEIEEIAWIDPSAKGDRLLAPLTRDHVLPLHIAIRSANP
jgi:8-oxo-dGTP diphosphatase